MPHISNNNVFPVLDILMADISYQGKFYGISCANHRLHLKQEYSIHRILDTMTELPENMQSSYNRGVPVGTVGSCTRGCGEQRRTRA